MTTKKKRDRQTNNLKEELAKISQLSSQVRFATTDKLDQAARAERANLAEQVLHEAFRLYNSNRQVPEAYAACKDAADMFERARQEAYTPDFSESYLQLKQGNPAGLETAVTFLESDPWFFGSGYAKADLIRLINRIELPRVYRKRLQNVVLLTIEKRDRREFRSYCRLAKKVDAPEFRSELLQLLESPTIDIRRRAQWVLKALQPAN